MATCKACGAEIIWVRTEGGRMIPLDAESVDDGNLVLENGRAIYVGSSPMLNLRRYKSHFATCPSAARFRRPRT